MQIPAQEHSYNSFDNQLFLQQPSLLSIEQELPQNEEVIAVRKIPPTSEQIKAENTDVLT